MRHLVLVTALLLSLRPFPAFGGFIPGFELPNNKANSASTVDGASPMSGKLDVGRSIGVILPLSGRYGMFGELVRRGMELANKVHDEGNVPTRLVFMDSGGDPARAAEAVSRLVEDESVVAIAGPILGLTAYAVGKRAEDMKIPLLALSQREGVPEIGEYVFRDALTPRAQIQTILEYALKEKGYTTFGVLSPETRSGREMADLFTRGVASHGGVVESVQHYPPKTRDFSQQIKQLVRNAGKREGEVPFQALFIPDYADKVGELAPQLMATGLGNVQLLGINGWDSPELLQVAGKYVEGAVLVDGFFVSSPDPVIRKFVDRYFEQYSEEPTILEAQGYDVVGLIRFLLERDDVRSREDMRRALSTMNLWPGVMGNTAFDAVGEARKDLFLIQVRNGNFEQIGGRRTENDEKRGQATF